jgi:hypothetical protein
MIIKKWIEYESAKEIDISLSAEDICLIFEENEDKEHNQTIMLTNINSLAGFLKGIPDEMINDLSDKLKKTIFEFLTEQTERFKPL